MPTSAFQESFDDDNQFAVSTSFFSDGSGDYFTLTDGSNIGSFVELSGFDGPFLAAQDLDGEGGPATVELLWSDLDISGQSNLEFSGLFAEDDASDGNEDWDAADFVKFEYAIDGGAFQDLLAFENDGSTFNSAPSQDTDFDGVGDGAVLTSTAQEFKAAIAGTGSLLDLRLTIALDSGDEDIAIDSLRIAQAVTIADNDAPLTLIHEIQGSGTVSPIEGSSVLIEGIVVGDFQGDNGLNGFFVQEEDADADTNAATSEGIFVFDKDFGVDVSVGDKVQVAGTVDEFFELTELTDVTNVSVLSVDEALPTAATVSFPIASLDELEAVEGMRITIPDTLFVTEYFNLDRFGEVRLASDAPSNAPGTDGRLDQYTQFNDPSVTGFAEYQEALATRQIVLDDGSRVQNPDTLIFGRGGEPLSSSNTLRGGDTVENLTGVLSFSFGDYRIQTNEGVDFQPTNPRPATPDDVGGSLKVVSFNVLNFFTTLDVEGNPGSGPNNLEPRGADSQAEFDRQLQKLTTAILDIDADVLGLVELENEFTDVNGDGQFAIDTLVNALNAEAGAGTYAYVDPGTPFVDTGDAISVGAIYKTSAVKIAEGTTVEILTDADLSVLGLEGPVFDGPSTNRAPLAVTFEELSSGEKFTLAVNHYKSKGSLSPGEGNEDIGDGQGRNNAIRLKASQAVNAWLGSDPTGSGDEDFLIVGDLNAYAQEDPVTFLENSGYTNLAEQFIGSDAYSFVFDGQLGTLDYALANPALLSQVTGVTEWHVNADEPDALDYNLDFGRDPSLFDGTIPYRNSDHDPLIVGLNLASSAPGGVINGGNGKDTIEGTEGDDILSGGNGKDSVFGFAGDDILNGGNGKDLLNGGDGDDLLNGGRGKDLILGGGGQDTAQYEGLQTDYTFMGTVDSFTVQGPGTGKDSLFSIEFLQFLGSDLLVAVADLFAS